MAAKQYVAVSASAFATISASTYATYVEIQEDGAAAPVGLKVKFPSDNFTQVYTYPASAQPIKIGVPPVTGKPGSAPLVGKPARSIPVPSTPGPGYITVNEPATVYCQIEGVSATNVRVDERP